MWKYLFLNASISTPPDTIDAWLEEARRTHDILLGEGHFDYQHGEIIKEVESE